MRKNLNPRNGGGERNIYCPYYSDCLDLVIKRTWENWGCKGCRHWGKKQDLYDSPPSFDNGIPYYSLSLDINLETM